MELYTEKIFENEENEINNEENGIFNEKRIMQDFLRVHYEKMFWNTSKSDLIYHYTTVSGFKGIMTSGCLWAGNLRFLNDAAEYENGKRICISELEKFLTEEKLTPKIRGYMQMILRHIKENETNEGNSWSIDNIFITSFCEEGNLLSQWRGYGGKIGISIGLDYSRMRGALIIPESKYRYARTHNIKLYREPDENNGGMLKIPSEVKWLQVEYDDETKAACYQQIFRNIVGVYEAYDGDYGHLEETCRSYLAADLLRQMFPAMKHKGFSEEKECRMVAHYMTDDPVDVSYREMDDLLIPYINFRILDYHGEPFSTVLPIRDIMIGPGKEQDKVYESVVYFLEHQGDPKLAGMKKLAKLVRKSDIPFVG